MDKFEKNDPKNMSPDAFDHLVYLRVFEGCNLHCEHCFIPANPKKIKNDVINNIDEIFSKFAKEGQRILIQWHGGEPTLLGANWMLNSIRTIEEKCKNKYIINHGIQTNLINYNKDWKEIYENYFDSSIGVSWDKDIRLMKRDKPETNKEFEKQFWAKLEELQNDNIEPYLVITSTKVFFDSFPNPIEFFEMLESKGIKKAHLERLTKTGYARENWEKLGMSNLEYSQYMSRFAKAYKIYQEKYREDYSNVLSMSPFDGLIESIDRKIKGEAGGYGCLSGNCDSNFHTIDANGYKKGCTAVTSEYDNKASLGGEIIQFIDFKSQRKIRQADCQNCEYKTICSSGCMATDKMDESGECSGSKKLFKTIEKIYF